MPLVKFFKFKQVSYLVLYEKYIIVKISTISAGNTVYNQISDSFPGHW